MADGLSHLDSARDLALFEVYWRDLYSFLESRGYELRPRFRPGWEPSWKTLARYTGMPEDSIGLPLYAFRARMIDATRVSDGKVVFLKQVSSSSRELQICRYLSSEENRQDPRNHAVPLLDVLVHPTDPDVSFMVMPLLRDLDSPPFETIEDVLECGEQILEGLVFLHEHDIAHRDCASRNLMMDGTAMYPRSFHPVFQRMLPDVSDRAPVQPRSAVRVTYYFVDFGISTWFSPDNSSKLVLGEDGVEAAVPELSLTVPYDPFKTDVFILGAMFRKKMLEEFSNMDMIAPLVASMTAHNPSLRPSAAEALQAWRLTRTQLSARQRRWRVKLRGESFLGSMFCDALTLLSSAAPAAMSMDATKHNPLD